MVLPSINAARTKNSLHAIQGFIIFLAWVLTIAVFTKGDGVDGRSGWYFGMVRLEGSTVRSLDRSLTARG